MLEIDAILLHINSNKVSWRGCWGAWLSDRGIKLVDGERKDIRIYAYSDKLVVCRATGRCWAKSGDHYLLVPLRWSERRKAKRGVNRMYRALIKKQEAERARDASIAASALAVGEKS